MKQLCTQRGAVLVMALLIVAAVASLATSFATSFHLSLARGENRWHGAQADAYLLGAESLGILVLRIDAEDDDENGEVDSLDEIWAQEERAFPIEGGWVKANLEDAQGRFNLNNLADKVTSTKSETSVAARFTEHQRRFIRLLQIFEEVPVSQDEAVAITEAVIDWLDSDDTETGFGGAESAYYGQREHPYAPANGLFTSASELRLIRGITPELYRELLPLVVVLPKGQGLNVNTAKVPVLRCLQAETELGPLGLEDAERLASSRPNEGYTDITDFVDNEVIRNSLPSTGNLDDTDLVVSSAYFIVHAQVQIVQQRRRMNSLLKRINDEEIFSIRRRLY